MKNLKKVLALSMAGCMAVGVLAGCNGSGSDSDNDSGNSAPVVGEESVDTSSVKQIYFLNFKPEISDKYDAIAKEYEKETGVKVKVQTAASGRYLSVKTDRFGTAKSKGGRIHVHPRADINSTPYDDFMLNPEESAYIIDEKDGFYLVSCPGIGSGWVSEAYFVENDWLYE